MKTHFRWITANFILYFAAGLIQAQRAHNQLRQPHFKIPAQTMHETGFFPIQSLSPMGFAGQIHCDSSGNVYIWSMPAEKPKGPKTAYQTLPNILQQPVRELTLDSGNIKNFILRTDYRTEPGGFTLSPSGHVYRLLRDNRTSSYKIVKYARGGSVDSTIAPDTGYPHYDIYNFAVFANGNFLLQGIAYTKKSGIASPIWRTFTIVDDDQGQFISNLNLIHVHKKINMQRLSFIYNTLLASSPDGMIYMIQPAHNPILRVIPPNGQTVTSIPIHAFHDQNYYPNMMSPAGQNHLLIEFGHKYNISSKGGNMFPKFTINLYVIIDPNTGNVIHTYLPPKKGGGILACALDSHTFEFLRLSAHSPMGLAQFTGN